MLFSSPVFLFLYLPVFFLAYFLSGSKRKNVAVLLASFLFYFWGEPTFSLIVVATIAIDWILTNMISRTDGPSFRKNLLLVLAVSVNVSLMVYFKYTNFLIANLNSVLGYLGSGKVNWANVALPIGVSFIVFEKITYIVDVYKGKSVPAKSVVSYATYILLFPKLLAGPIVKYHDIEPQLYKRNANLEDIIHGLSRFVYGLAKKVLIADALGVAVDDVFRAPPESLSSYAAWMGAIFFTFQIFFDFSAYSDMAIGLGRVLGFTLRENFNRPYYALNFTDFWRRWHISLSSWIREYLYVPLGGNHGTKARTYINLWLCFLISGIWHGANWTYIVWGIYHGFFLVCDKLFWVRISERLPKFINVCITVFFVIIGWVVFRSQDLHITIVYL